MAKKYYKGRFSPKNPEKYRGDPTNIIYRSLWELRFFQYLDNNVNVVWWQSEEIAIPYESPLDSRYHRYFPDVLVCVRDKNGNEKIQMIEIKPFAQTQEPKVKKKVTKRYINEVATWGVNQAKWTSAKRFCEKKGWEFVLITEKELGI